MSELRVKDVFRDQLPSLPEEKYRKLEKDICERGCFDPIRLWKGYIIDGHNRYKICTENNVAFKTLSLDECFEDETDVRIWIIDHQDGRRELSDFQKIELRIEREHLVESKQGQRSDLTSVRRRTEVDKPHRQSAKQSGVGKTKYAEGKYLAQNAPEEVKEKLRKGETAIKTEYKKLKQEEKKQKHQETLESTEFPEGKYRIIYADPPWDYGSSPTCKNTATPDLKYPVMPLEAICDLPVKGIADENAVLFLWTTSYHIFQSAKVLDAWGFSYKSQFIWDKVKHNMGCYNSVRHEILLVATKGSCTPDNVELIDSVQSIERTRHSEKPEKFREIIETLYKYGNKLELFARKKTEDWDIYGNEAR